MHTSSEVPVTFVNLTMSKEEEIKIDAMIYKVLGYSAWVEEILIAPQTRKEFDLRKSIVCAFNSRNHTPNYDTGNSLEILADRQEMGHNRHTFDTIDNTRKPVILVLDGKTGVYKSVEE